MTPSQIELIASCAEIGVEGAEAPEEDIAGVEAFIQMIRDMQPIVNENEWATIPLLGPNEQSIIMTALDVLMQVTDQLPPENVPYVRKFHTEWTQSMKDNGFFDDDEEAATAGD